MVTTERSEARCVGNETNTAPVLCTVQTPSILTGFLCGGFMTKGFLPITPSLSHPLPGEYVPTIAKEKRKKKKPRKPATQHIAIFQCQHLPLFLFVATDPRAIWVYDMYTT